MENSELSAANVDRELCVGTSVGEKEGEVEEKGSRLSLSVLLDPKTWSLPGWDPTTAPSTSNAETIGRLDMSIALLSRYRNSLRPFNRLSVDILLLIFSELELDHWDPFQSGFGCYSWMTVSRVCHSWRDIILSSPILWRQLNTRYPAAALTALERSGDSGICLAIPDDSFPDDDTKQQALAVIAAVAKHMHRLRWLYVRSDVLKTDAGQFSYILQPLVNLPAPMLEHLITCKLRGSGAPAPLPTVFAGHTPQLHRLRIHYLHPHIGSISLGRLKYLEFCGKKHGLIQMGVSQLLDILERCPLLEVLDVAKVSWQAAEENDVRTVHLDRLRYLGLGREKGSIVSSIFTRLVIPECAFKLHVWFDRHEGNKFYTGLPTEDQLDVAHPLRGLKKLHLQFLTGFEGVLIKGQTNTMPFEVHGLLDVETVTHQGDMDVVAAHIFQSIMRALDVERLEHFSMSEMHSSTRWTLFTRKLWTDFFNRMPNLKTFGIATDPCYDEGFSRPILVALSTPDPRTTRLPCPALESLNVSGDKTWSSLQCYTMAKRRAQAGHPLKRVSMGLSHYASFEDPEETDLPMLRKYVETVDLNPVDLEFPDWPDTTTT